MKSSLRARTESSSSLKDWQIIVWHLQDQTCHRRAIFRADLILPRTILLLARHEPITQAAIPVRPIFTAAMPHDLGGVVIGIEEIALLSLHARRRRLLFQVRQGSICIIGVYHSS